RMVAYTGKTLTYDEALASEEILGPPIEDINWDMDYPLAPVAQPGITKFK
ncbi:MAG: myo-inositol 2-dehydrogenase/D-chiro-inositol 1-dehydrogenase, partial [Saprospiraceae bacterium]